MDYQPLKIGDLTAKVPVIQGGMGIGISLGNLAGTVAKVGGIGIISAAQIGFKEEDFDQNPEKANIRAIKKEYEKARKIAPEGVIGFNIMVAMRHYEKYVEAAIEAGADLIISGAGLPMDLPKIAGERPVKLAPIVSSEKSARVIFRYWEKKYKRLPDLVVIEGPLAGGHLGFSVEELKMYEAECGNSDRGSVNNKSGNPHREPEDSMPANCEKKKYEDEVKKILETVKNYEEKCDHKIPVVLAGGIDEASKVREAFALGVDGVQVATRFVTTVECDADIRYKQAYLDAQKEDIVIVKSPVGMPGRAILNPFQKKVRAGEKIPHSPCHGCLHKCNPTEIPYCITDALIHAAKGEVEDALLFCGANAYKATKIETVEEVVQDLFKA